MSGAYGDRALLERDLRPGFEAEFAAIDSEDTASTLFGPVGWAMRNPTTS